jgi:hypothetical protein
MGYVFSPKLTMIVSMQPPEKYLVTVHALKVYPAFALKSTVLCAARFLSHLE